jgi:hypothetical protein
VKLEKHEIFISTNLDRILFEELENLNGFLSFTNK